MPSRSSSAAAIAVPTPPSSGTRRRTRASKHDEPWPAVDDHIVMPESGVEVLDGKVYFVPPASEEHGESHFDLGAVLRAHVVQGYSGAHHLLTRTGKRDNFAPDASVYPSARDPETEGRQLEEIAFEIVAKQAFSISRRKARKLVQRGVRRVFCLALKKKQVLEWSPITDKFEPLPDDAVIEDRCFVRPIPTRALLDSAESDRAIINALHARKDSTLMALLDEAREQGVEKGIEKSIRLERLNTRREVLYLVLRSKGHEIDGHARAHIDECSDIATLERWILAATESKWAGPDVGDPP